MDIRALDTTGKEGIQPATIKHVGRQNLHTPAGKTPIRSCPRPQEPCGLCGCPAGGAARGQNPRLDASPGCWCPSWQ